MINRKRRHSDNDKHFGPFTLSKLSTWNPISVILKSGTDEYPGCNLHLSAFGYALITEIPAFIKPYRRWVSTEHYDWSNGPGSGYWDEHANEYGIQYHEGFLQVFMGPQTHSSETTKSWSKFLPWTQWRFVRRSFYNPDGSHFWTEPTRKQVPKRKAWDEMYRQKDLVPKEKFIIEDYDGEQIRVTCFIEEMQWEFGEGWFKWLSFFRKSMIRRSIDIEYASEVGKEKGSWKGGVLGESCDIKNGESIETALRRHCETEHRSKNGKYRIKFLKKVVD